MAVLQLSFFKPLATLEYTEARRKFQTPVVLLFNFLRAPVNSVVKNLLFLLLTSLMAGAQLAIADEKDPISADTITQVHAQNRTHILQLVANSSLQRNYPSALPTLLEHIAAETPLNVAIDPIFIESFEDPKIFEHSFIYINFADRSDWQLTEKEQLNLKNFLERGGFLYLDAGINASFLREKNASMGQFHSFAEWQVSPEVSAMMAEIFPEKQFRSIPRNDPLFRSFYVGLPDASVLPITVRDYVINEKWPQGSYAAMGLYIEGRLAVLAMPILAMGWGKDEIDNWETFIGFRIRESAEGLSQRLSEAAYSGVRFEVMREDGLQDVIYTQNRGMPSWVQEPGGDWRLFRYYYTQEISDYAHIFYTRLGVNVFIHAFTQ